MRQAVMEATNGSLDYFLTNPNFPRLVAFAFEYPMQENVGAMIGDDNKGYFDSGMRNYLESTFNEENSPNYNASNLNYNNLFMEFVMEINLKMKKEFRYPLKNKYIFEKEFKRKYYHSSGILICRGDNLAATFKLLGGTNVSDCGHQHDDAGTYQIMKNKVIVAGDVGGPIYYEGNWKDRYNGPIFNSYSHPLPIIDDKLQVRSTAYYSSIFRPKVLDTFFSDEIDKITFDLKAAYNCSSLVSLNRTNTFYRSKSQVKIKDSVIFSKPTKFEVALSTRGEILNLSKKGLKKIRGTLSYLNVTLNFMIQSQHDFKYIIDKQHINGVIFTRLGISFQIPKLRIIVYTVYD